MEQNQNMNIVDREKTHIVDVEHSASSEEETHIGDVEHSASSKEETHLVDVEYSESSEEETHRVGVGHLVSSIKETMSRDLFMSPNRCIFKTPIALYRQNVRAYFPDAFSIGPFHHGNPILKATETIKANYLQSLLHKSRCPNTMLVKMIKVIKTFEREAREYYAGPINYSPDDFVKILLIDSCFIIELFYSSANEKGKVEYDPIFGTPSMLEVLDHDLILLENQVPWAILVRLFDMSIGRVCQKTLVQLAIEFFLNVYSFTISDPPPQDIKHIPDLFKKLLVSSMGVDELGKKMSYRWDPELTPMHLPEAESEPELSPTHLPEAEIEPELSPMHLPEAEIKFRKSKSSYRWEPVPSATRLLEAGIKFRKSKSTNMFDIKFRNGVLEIPQIRIHEITETFMKNLISFEQCYTDSDDMITSYAILLDNLIDTTKDVEILRERKILSICMNPEDAVQFFNKLYHTTCVNNCNYVALCKDLNEHCEKRWPRWRAVLVRRYFNTPWVGLSTVAAVTLLILSFLQTFFSIKK